MHDDGIRAELNIITNGQLEFDSTPFVKHFRPVETRENRGGSFGENRFKRNNNNNNNSNNNNAGSFQRNTREGSAGTRDGGNGGINRDNRNTGTGSSRDNRSAANNGSTNGRDNRNNNKFGGNKKRY